MKTEFSEVLNRALCIIFALIIFVFATSYSQIVCLVGLGLAVRLFLGCLSEVGKKLIFKSGGKLLNLYMVIAAIFLRSPLLPFRRLTLLTYHCIRLNSGNSRLLLLTASNDFALFGYHRRLFALTVLFSH